MTFPVAVVCCCYVVKCNLVYNSGNVNGNTWLSHVIRINVLQIIFLFLAYVFSILIIKIITLIKMIIFCIMNDLIFEMLIYYTNIALFQILVMSFLICKRNIWLDFEIIHDNNVVIVSLLLYLRNSRLYLGLSFSLNIINEKFEQFLYFYDIVWHWLGINSLPYLICADGILNSPIKFLYLMSKCRIYVAMYYIYLFIDISADSGYTTIRRIS